VYVCVFVCMCAMLLAYCKLHVFVFVCMYAVLLAFCKLHVFVFVCVSVCVCVCVQCCWHFVNFKFVRSCVCLGGNGRS